MKRTKEEIEKLQRYMNRIFPYYYRDNSIREGIKSIVNAIPKWIYFISYRKVPEILKE